MESGVTRRGFLRTGVALAGGLALHGAPASSTVRDLGWARPGGLVPPGSWWAGGGPRTAAASATIVGPDEPGERLVLSGAIYGPDGRTPLQGVTVYVYQTDVRGLYNPEGRFGVPHRILGYAVSDESGRYQFHTIKPGIYPNRTTPAHVHMTVCREDMPEWWLPEVRFEGDALLTDADYRTSRNDGAFGNVRPLTVRDGRLHCTRDLRL